MKNTLFRVPTILGVQTEQFPSTDALRRLALAAIVGLATGLRLANLDALGYANHYYTAAVVSMLQSWHNFIFVAAEPGGAVSVDKPPLGLWLQTISAYFLGVNGFAVLLPEIAAGVLAVVLVYHLVRRSFGSIAGLLAALALAITPVVVATDRNNTIDSLLILTLLLAAWAFIKATESSRLRYLLLGAVLVGLGFNIKMLQAFLPLPAFYALYFFGSTNGVWRKISHLAVTTALLLAVSLAWAIAVDLTPANQRPYVGSSSDNSVLTLALGYNGLQRLMGGARGGGMRPPVNFDDSAARPAGASNASTAPGNVNRPMQRPGPPNGGGGPPGGGSAVGPLRLFTAPLSKEISWLLPFGLFSAALLLVSARWRWPLSPTHQAVALWGGWLLTAGSALSIAQHFHEYYLSMLGAPLAALVGIGVIELWHLRRRSPWLASGLLLAAACCTLGLQLITATTFASGVWWLLPIMALFMIGAGLVLVSAGAARPRMAAAGFAGVAAALLLVPGIWSGLTTLHASANSSLPSAYGGRSSGPPSALTAPGSRVGGAGPVAKSLSRAGLQINQKLLDYLEPRTQDTLYLMAVPSSMQGADYVITTGRPVLYMGGFKGDDPVVAGDDLARLVAENELRYIYWGGGGSKPDVSAWVTGHCAPVTGFESVIRNAGAPDGTTYTSSAPGRGEMQGSLYECGS